MGFSPKLLIKSTFRNNSNSNRTRRNPSLPSTSDGSPLFNSLTKNIGHIQPNYNNSSYSSVRSGSNASSLSNTSHTKASSEILAIISEQKVCVIRKYGAQEETLVNSIVDRIGKTANIIPVYLTISQQTACHLLNLFERNGLPLIFINGNIIGGLSELLALEKNNFITDAFQTHEYDLAVIIEGSVGLIAAQEASLLGKKVICFDYCSPNQSIENKFNVLDGSSIIKQIFFDSANFFVKLKNAEKLGFNINCEQKLSWEKLQESINAQLSKISEERLTQLKQSQVEYIQGNGKFTGTHEITVTDSTGRYRKISAEKFLIAVGQYTQFPNVANAQKFCIKVKEFLLSPKNPKKTLCVGNSFLAFEISSILCAFEVDVTILTDNQFDVNLDRELIERLRTNLLQNGVKFKTGIITELDFLDANKELINVKMKREKAEGDFEFFEDNYYTVLLATENGASDFLTELNIQSFNVKLTNNFNQLQTRAQQCVGGLPNVYAIGGCTNNFPKSTSATATQYGNALIKRLYLSSSETIDFNTIPTTILTPHVQYSFCGLSQELAFKKFGAENVSIFKKSFGNLVQNFCKIICHKFEQDRILGVHIIAENSNSIIESIAVALKFNAHRNHLDNLISINMVFKEVFV